MIYPAEVKKAIELLEDKGFEAYIVGGCLRNMMMGKPPHDWDMTTSAPPHETLDVFRCAGIRVIETGLKHGTVTAIINSLPIEITTFRIDGEYTDSRHPDSVSFTGRIEEDLSRRDFTVNAMAYSEKRGLVDLFGGKEDLADNRLKCVGDPEKRFDEDALRILRAFRFSSEHGFEIDENTEKAIEKKRDGLKKISRERIYSELIRMLMGESAAKATEKLLKLRLMPCLFDFFKDEYAPCPAIFRGLERKKHIRLAVFFANFPADAFEAALASLKMSNEDKLAVKKLISGVDLIKKAPPYDLLTARKFIRIYGDMTDDILKTARALGIDSEQAERTVCEALKSDFPKSPAELAIGGRELIDLGARGTEIGVIISLLMEKTAEDPSLNTRERLITAAKKYISEIENEHCDNK